MWYDKWIEKNKIPDTLLRKGIRRLLKQRLREEDKGDPETQQNHLFSLIDQLKTSPIAVNTGEANEQHYEIPTTFYQYCLGKHVKYSSGYWRPGVESLDDAEQDMLEITCQRAALSDGLRVLELGCGWGSLSLYMAARYPNSSFTVVSNSRTQKEYIDGQARQRGLENLLVITADMNSFAPGRPAPDPRAPAPGSSTPPDLLAPPAASFDRVVSVEMFEHMRNYRLLMQKVSSFLKADGKLFVHIFTHRQYAYLFEVKDSSDWMSKYFFTGGIMPSDHLLFYFNDDLRVEKHWHVSGTHYARTAEAWLKNMDGHRAEIMPLFENTYGKDQAIKWWVYWRIFYMACAELWNYNGGKEWMVSHYLFNQASGSEEAVKIVS